MMTDRKMAVVACGILLVALSRFVPHPPNFTPVIAMALFAGRTLGVSREGLLLPLMAMLLSDLFLGFHASIPLVYLCLGLTVVWGARAQRTGALVGAGLGSCLLFFVVTNLGVWAFSGMYANSLSGLFHCYLAALPFAKNMVLGTLVYSVVLFGSLKGSTRLIGQPQQS